MSTSRKVQDSAKTQGRTIKFHTNRFDGRTPAVGVRSFQEKLNDIDWRDLELFLAVIEAGSLRAGAAKTRHAVGTIRRRLQRIEDKLGDIIARREPKGLQLTPTGQELLRISREMRSSRQRLEIEHSTSNQPEQIRIAITEGLGTYWVMPRLVEFQKTHPGFDVELHCDMQRSDVAGGECDLAIQLERPADGSTIVRLVGFLHLMPFAAERYLRNAGVPKSVDEWPNHRLVWQEADQVASHLLPYFLGTSQREGLIGIRTNSSSAHFRAVATGGGIGILPTYARAVSRRVRPLDIEVRLRREIFCVINSVRAQSPAVQLVIAFLETCFSGEIYPWFRDEFVHPRDFEETLSSQSVISLFEGFIDGADTDEPV